MTNSTNTKQIWENNYLRVENRDSQVKIIKYIV